MTRPVLDAVSTETVHAALIALRRFVSAAAIPALRTVATPLHVTTDMNEALDGADVVMMLRLQHERMQGLYLPSLREYFTLFGLTAARLAHAAPDVIVMHPGPMNRGVEIDSEVADGRWSVILDQVANGVAVRMAVLYLLAGGEGENVDK